MNKDHVLYGKKHIEEPLNSIKYITNENLLNKMTKCIDDYANGKEQADDICMLSLSYGKE